MGKAIGKGRRRGKAKKGKMNVDSDSEQEQTGQEKAMSVGKMKKLFNERRHAHNA